MAYSPFYFFLSWAEIHRMPSASFLWGEKPWGESPFYCPLLASEATILWKRHQAHPLSQAARPLGRACSRLASSRCACVDRRWLPLRVLLPVADVVGWVRFW